MLLKGQEQINFYLQKLQVYYPVVFGDRNQFVLAPSKAHVTQNYIVDLRFVSYKGKDVTVQKTNGSEYILVTLDLNDNFKRKEYDLYKATEAYKKRC